MYILLLRLVFDEKTKILYAMRDVLFFFLNIRIYNIKINVKIHAKLRIQKNVNI